MRKRKILVFGLCILILMTIALGHNYNQQEQKTIQLSGYDIQGRPIFVEGSFEGGWEVHPLSPGIFDALSITDASVIARVEGMIHEKLTQQD